MSCKYPKDSRMYYSCILCDDRNMCKDAITIMPYDIPFPETKPQKYILPSASQANQMTKENIKNCYEQELIEITKKIKKAIADRKFSISGDGSLKYETTEKLKELVYKIETDLSWWSISWK